MGQSPKISIERIELPTTTALALGGVEIPGRSGWVATIEFGDGSKVVADRLDTESTWLVNGEWAAGSSFPKFWNGKLSRCTCPIPLSAELSALCGEAVVR